LQQAAVLKAVAEQAPHGKGLRTVVNTAVRDALQVSGAVHVGGGFGVLGFYGSCPTEYYFDFCCLFILLNFVFLYY
jgi:hypothetical protein